MNVPTALSPPDAGSGGAQPSDLGAQVRGMAGDAKHSAEQFAEQRKADGAERLEGVAKTVSRVADEVAEESPAMADFVRKAAAGLDGVSRDLKDKSVGDLVEMAKGFARREPAAFLAASAVAGFALSRLLKSSTPVASGAHAPGVSPNVGARSLDTLATAGSTEPQANLSPLRPDAEKPARSGVDFAPASPALAPSPRHADPVSSSKYGEKGDAI